MKRMILTAIMLLWALGSAQAEILYVDKDGTAPYTDIQPAISAASSGDTIMVAASFNNYDGFTVDRCVHIVGAGTDTLPGQASKVNGVVTITSAADSATLRSLWISYNMCNYYDSLAAVLRLQSGARGIRVSRCYIENTNGGSGYSWCAHVGGDIDATFIACGFKVYSTGDTRSCIKFMADPRPPSSLIVSNCVMLNGPIWGGQEGDLITVRHCFIWDPADRGVIFASAAGGTVKNTFLHESGGAPFFSGAPNFEASYCATMGAIPAGPGNIAAYSDADLVRFGGDYFRSDFHLTANSVLRDAGDPITPPDLDGSRADIGVYGGQTPFVYFGLPDFPIVTALEVPVSVPKNGVLHIGSRGRVGQGGGQ